MEYEETPEEYDARVRRPYEMVRVCFTIERWQRERLTTLAIGMEEGRSRLMRHIVEEYFDGPEVKP